MTATCKHCCALLRHRGELGWMGDQAGARFRCPLRARTATGLSRPHETAQ